MEKSQIDKYLEMRGMKGDDRITRDKGNQYLNNFLVEFANYVKKKTIKECCEAMKKINPQ